MIPGSRWLALPPIPWRSVEFAWWMTAVGDESTTGLIFLPLGGHMRVPDNCDFVCLLAPGALRQCENSKNA